MTDRARLTNTIAHSARPREREYAIHDTVLQGFMLRVQPNGARSWALRFRHGDKPRRVTIGKQNAMSADQARAAAVRLILLIGCRPGEIRCLRWSEVKADRLILSDAKTGPRCVLLGAPAQKVLDALGGKSRGEWVFPAESGDGPMTRGALHWFWTKTRDLAGIVADARLHDLRHAHASHAVMNGESLLVRCWKIARSPEGIDDKPLRASRRGDAGPRCREGCGPDKDQTECLIDINS